jgi:DNA-binding PadR family transcriptional regulator
MKREISKTDAARRAMKAAGKPITIYEMIEAMESDMKRLISKGQLYALLGMMQTSGEVATEGRADTRKYSLTGRTPNR